MVEESLSPSHELLKQAGKEAGMITVAANFGFINDEINIHSWEADLIIDNPLSLKEYLID